MHECHLAFKNPRHIADKGYHGLPSQLGTEQFIRRFIKKKQQHPIPIYIPECMGKP